MELEPGHRRIEKALDEVGFCLQGIREGFDIIEQECRDTSERDLHHSVLNIINGASERLLKVQEVTRRLREHDPAAYQRLDSQVEESNFLDFSRAFRKARLGFEEDRSFLRERIGKAIRRLGEDIWKDSIENWLESIESLLEEYSEIAEGTSAQGPLKLLSKGITSIAKAISATKDGSQQEAGSVQ